MIQEWELNQYQMPAAQAVYRLGGDPNAPVEFPDGSIKPFWMHYAVKMHELRVMTELLRQYGLS